MASEPQHNERDRIRIDLIDRAIALQLELGLPELSPDSLPNRREFPKDIVGEVMDVEGFAKILRERIRHELVDGLELKPDASPQALAWWVCTRRLRGSVQSGKTLWRLIALTMRDVLRERAAPLPSTDHPDRDSVLSAYLSSLGASTAAGSVVIEMPVWVSVAHLPTWVAFSADLIEAKTRSTPVAGEYLLLHIFTGLSAAEIAEVVDQPVSEVEVVLAEAISWADGMFMFDWMSYFPESHADGASAKPASSAMSAMPSDQS